MIVGGVLRTGSSVGVMVGVNVLVAVGGIGVKVAVDVCVAVLVGVDGFTVGVGCVNAVPQAERVMLVKKKRERSFFIVHLVDGIILCLVTLSRAKSLYDNLRDPSLRSG